MTTQAKLLAAILIALVYFPSMANAAPTEDDKFSVSLGWFITSRDTESRLDSSLGSGSGTDLEDDLGLDNSDSVARLDATYRVNDRHRIDISVFDMSRASSLPIQKDIQWGDRLFTVDTVVNTSFDLYIYKAAYTYSFMQRETGFLGVTAGLYVADSEIRLAEQNLGAAEVGAMTAPLPVIGVRGERYFGDRWTLRGSGEFFAIEFDNVDGSLVDLYVGMDYKVLDHMSIGLGINSVTLDVDASKNAFQGALNWEYAGALLFLKFDF